ncbi:MAG: ATP-binding protein [Bauldia sp.]
MTDTTYPGRLADRLAGIADPAAFADGIFRFSPFGIAIFASDGHCVLANPAFKDLFGSVPPPEYSLFEDDIGERLGIVAILRRAFEGERVTTPPFEYDASQLQNVRVAGRRVQIEMSAFPLPEADGTIRHVAMVYRDVTEGMLAREQLSHAQKLAAVGQLTAGIAHDFNNLLTVILNGIEDALPVVSDPVIRASLQAAARATGLAEATTRRLLTFGRRQALTPAAVDVGEEITSLADLLRRTLPPSVEVKIAVAHDIPRCLLDRDQLQSALVNLALNGRDAMPEGGTITIAAENIAIDEKFTESDGEAVPGDYVLISVADTGTGMTAEVRERAIEPFFTTKDAEHGSGLGLSGAYGFARQSGGLLRLYSEPGHGTTVRLYLPCRPVGPASAPAERPQPGTVEMARNREVVLVVDDDPDVFKVAKSRVERLGYRVLSAIDGPSALAVVDTGTPIDVLFTDVFLRGPMQGPALAKIVAERLPDVRVLFTSGHAHPLAGQQFSRLGLVLPKPYLDLDLSRKLRQALDGRPFRSLAEGDRLLDRT